MAQGHTASLRPSRAGNKTQPLGAVLVERWGWGREKAQATAPCLREETGSSCDR